MTTKVNFGQAVMCVFQMQWRWLQASCVCVDQTHNGVIKWKHSELLLAIVRGIHRSPADFPHKGQWRGALKFSLICAWTNGWASNRDAGDLRRHRAHYDTTVMTPFFVNYELLLSISFTPFVCDKWNPFVQPSVFCMFHIGLSWPVIEPLSSIPIAWLK